MKNRKKELAKEEGVKPSIYINYIVDSNQKQATKNDAGGNSLKLRWISGLTMGAGFIYLCSAYGHKAIFTFVLILQV